MSEIQTTTQTIASGSYDLEERYLNNDETPESLTARLLRDKIDELVIEVNKLKNDQLDIYIK